MTAPYHISLSVRCPMNGLPIPNGHCTTDLESDTGNNDSSLPHLKRHTTFLSEYAIP